MYILTHNKIYIWTRLLALTLPQSTEGAQGWNLRFRPVTVGHLQS